MQNPVGKKSKIDNWLKKWFGKLSNYKVSYKNGFFNIYAIVTTPDDLYEGLGKMPFCKQDTEKDLIYTNTPFIRSKIYYRNLAEGLWLMAYDNFYKQNFSVHNICTPEAEIGYACIHIQSTTIPVDGKFSLIDGNIVSNRFWIISKAWNTIENHDYKGAKDECVTIFFTKEWLKNNAPFAMKTQEFLQHKCQYLILHENQSKGTDFFASIYPLLESEINSEINQLLFKEVLNFITYFEDFFTKQNILPNHLSLENNDLKKILQVDHLLKKHIFLGFPGIEKIAAEVHISPTKLKNDFKTVHHTSIFKYFQTLQMERAQQLLIEAIHPIKIKDLAKTFNYSNASKFSRVFKAHIGILPSEVENKLDQYK